MRSFDQLTQDQQMVAVEAVIDEIIDVAAAGIVPICFQEFSDQIEEVMNEVSFSDSLEDALTNKIESYQPMKVAMLHYAGSLAKAALYYEDYNNDNVVVPFTGYLQ